MDLANMYMLIRMIETLDLKDENGNKHYIVDYVFCKDGKSVYVELSNRSSYTFTI